MVWPSIYLFLNNLICKITHTHTHTHTLSLSLSLSLFLTRYYAISATVIQAVQHIFDQWLSEATSLPTFSCEKKFQPFTRDTLFNDDVTVLSELYVYTCICAVYFCCCCYWYCFFFVCFVFALFVVVVVVVVVVVFRCCCCYHLFNHSAFRQARVNSDQYEFYASLRFQSGWAGKRKGHWRAKIYVFYRWKN